MKPSQLENNDHRNFVVYSETYKVYTSYREQDCVVAYRRSFMGYVFLIRGIKGFFGYVVINRNVLGTRPELTRKKDLKYIKLLFDEESKDDKLVIIDNQRYKEFERLVLFESIDTKN